MLHEQQQQQQANAHRLVIKFKRIVDFYVNDLLPINYCIEQRAPWMAIFLVQIPQKLNDRILLSSFSIFPLFSTPQLSEMNNLIFKCYRNVVIHYIMLAFVRRSSITLHWSHGWSKILAIPIILGVGLFIFLTHHSLHIWNKTKVMCRLICARVLVF